MSKCRRCHRNLVREPWRSKGIGKICSQKEEWEKDKATTDDNGDIHVPYDGGDIFISRLASQSYDNSGQLTLAMHTCSGIKTNVKRIVTRHSPSGFNFGYGGSGPADLALNICYMFCKNKQDAEKIYQNFKWKFIAVDAKEELVIKKNDIVTFLNESGINNINV